MTRRTSLLLSEIFPPRPGGSGRWFWELYRRLPREEFLLAVGAHPQQQAFDETHALRVLRTSVVPRSWGVLQWRGLRDYWRIAGQMAALVKRERVAAVHAARCLPEGWIAWILNRRLRVPYLVYVHGEDVEAAATSREFSWMVRQVFRRSSLVIANSANTAGILRGQWQLPEGKVEIVRPGVDVERFQPAPRDCDLRRQWGWGDRPVILTVGRLQQRKGHDQLIRALPRVRQRVPAVLYAVIGEGEERGPLQRLVQELQLQEHVIWHGETGDEQLVQAYQQCDVFALPNRQVGRDIEGFGMVLLEAQACGKPVIAGASGGTAETMIVNQTGRLVPCEGPQLLADALVDLLTQPELCRQMGARGREWVLEQFRWEGIADGCAGLFRRLAESGTVRAATAPSPSGNAFEQAGAER